MGDVIAGVLADPAQAWHLVVVAAVLGGWIRGGFVVIERRLARMERKIDALIRHERLADKLDEEGNPKPTEEINRELLAAWNWTGEGRKEE